MEIDISENQRGRNAVFIFIFLFSIHKLLDGDKQPSKKICTNSTSEQL